MERIRRVYEQQQKLFCNLYHDYFLNLNFYIVNLIYFVCSYLLLFRSKLLVLALILNKQSRFSGWVPRTQANWTFPLFL